MDREQAKEYLKGMMPRYLKERGILSSGYFKCLNPAHVDPRPMMSFNPKDNTVHCFGCGATYDIFGVLGIDYNLPSYGDQFNKACELFLPEESIRENRITSSGIKQLGSKPQSEKVVDYTAYFRECALRVNDTEYFKDLGFSDELIRNYTLGVDPDFRGAEGSSFPAVIIPHGAYGFLAINLEEPEDSAFRLYFGKNTLFNPTIPETAKEVFISSTELEALSFLEIGKTAIAVGDRNNVHELITLLSHTRHGVKIYLISSEDPDWRDLTDMIKNELDALEIKCHEIKISYPYQNVCDYLERDRQDFEKRVTEIEEIFSVKKQKLPATIKFEELTDSDSFMEPAFGTGVYTIECTPSIRRKLIASWTIHTQAEDLHYIYVSGNRDWQLLGQEIMYLATELGEKYYLQAPKVEELNIATNENAHDISEKILHLFLAHRLKNDTDNIIILNVGSYSVIGDKLLTEILDIISDKIHFFKMSIVVFFENQGGTLPEEIGNQHFTITKESLSEEEEETSSDIDTSYAQVTTQTTNGEKWEFTIKLDE